MWISRTAHPQHPIQEIWQEKHWTLTRRRTCSYQEHIRCHSRSHTEGRPKALRDLGQRITIDCNLKVTNFYDITLNLKNGTCRKNNPCPRQGKCLTPSVIYTVEVKAADEDNSKCYIRLTELPLKSRYYVHQQSFRDAKHKYSTELSRHVWELKQKKKESTITWSIAGIEGTFVRKWNQSLRPMPHRQDIHHQ